MVKKKKILYIHGIASHGNDEISTKLKKDLSFFIYSPTFSPNLKKTKKILKKLLKKDWDLIITFSFGSLVLNSVLNKKYKNRILMINPIFKETIHLKKDKKIPDYSTKKPKIYKIKKRDKKIIKKSIKNKFKFKKQYVVYSKYDEITKYNKKNTKCFVKKWEIEEKHNIKNVEKIKKAILEII